MFEASLRHKTFFWFNSSFLELAVERECVYMCVFLVHAPCVSTYSTKHWNLRILEHYQYEVAIEGWNCSCLTDVDHNTINLTSFNFMFPHVDIEVPWLSLLCAGALPPIAILSVQEAGSRK